MHAGDDTSSEIAMGRKQTTFDEEANQQEIIARMRSRPGVAAAVALSMTHALEKRLEELYSMLGLKLCRIDRDPEGMLSFRLQAADLVDHSSINFTYHELMEWARWLNAIDEAYLNEAVQLTSNPDAWLLYLEAAQKLMEDSTKRELLPELTTAYGFVDAARRNLRHTCYIYLRQMRGLTVAEANFPEGVDEEILALAFPR